MLDIIIFGTRREKANPFLCNRGPTILFFFSTQKPTNPLHSSYLWYDFQRSPWSHMPLRACATESCLAVIKDPKSKLCSLAVGLWLSDWPMQRCLTHPVGSWPIPPSDKQPCLWLSGNAIELSTHAPQLPWVLHCDQEAQCKECWNKAPQGCGIFTNLRDCHLWSHTESYWKRNFYIGYLSLSSSSLPYGLAICSTCSRTKWVLQVRAQGSLAELWTVQGRLSF